MRHLSPLYTYQTGSGNTAAAKPSWLPVGSFTMQSLYLALASKAKTPPRWPFAWVLSQFSLISRWGQKAVEGKNEAYPLFLDSPTFYSWPFSVLCGWGFRVYKHVTSISSCSLCPTTRTPIIQSWHRIGVNLFVKPLLVMLNLDIALSQNWSTQDLAPSSAPFPVGGATLLTESHEAHNRG